MNRLGTSAQTRNTGRQTRILNQLKRAKKLYLMGDFTQKEYLLGKARVENAIAELAPVTSRGVLDAREFLQDFGQIWRVATDEERKKLLGPTIDIAYILEGSIKAIKPKPSMYNLLRATIGRRSDR